MADYEYRMGHVSYYRIENPTTVVINVTIPYESGPDLTQKYEMTYIEFITKDIKVGTKVKMKLNTDNSFLWGVMNQWEIDKFIV
jgi:hypothetical protein